MVESGVVMAKPMTDELERKWREGTGHLESGEIESLFDEIRRLRKENAKLRKVAEAAESAVETSQKDGAYLILVNDFEDAVAVLEPLDEALRELDGENSKC